MNPNLLSTPELTNHTLQQFFSLENNLYKNRYDLNDIGNLLPGSVMLQNLDAAVPNQVVYMNDWGCQKLNHSLKEIQDLGENYYKKFFVEDQITTFQNGISHYFEKKDTTSGYHFFQQVKTGKNNEMEWYLTMCKFLRTKDPNPTSLLLISNPVSGIRNMAKKLDNILGQDKYVSENFDKFNSLSKREKEIIVLLAEGKSSKEISELLYLSTHTIETHRKNIRKKAGVNSLAELIKFAIGFDLIGW